MKKFAPFVLSTITALLASGAGSVQARYVTPRVAPTTATAAAPAVHNPLNVPSIRTVTSTADAGAGSLREAVSAAGAGDIIVFDLPLPASISLLSTLVIAKDLEVRGPGPDKLTVMRSAAPGTTEFRVLEITAGVVTLSGISIQNGIAYSGTSLHDNTGGGILNRADLTLSNCVVTANSAPNTYWGPGNPYEWSYGFGAGIFSDKSSKLSVLNSTISNNGSDYAAGGVFTLYTAPLLLSGSTVSGNSAVIQAGGVNVQGCAGTIQNTTISSNSTPADAFASALLLITWPGETLAVDVTATTIAGNVGSTNGAIILAAYSGSGGYTGRFLSTLVADNVGPNFFMDATSLISLGNNLDSDGTSGLLNGVNGDIVGTTASPVAALLSPLGNYGGPTATMALQPGSPAIDNGSCLDAGGSPLLVDQRGVARPQGAGCDMGAYEYQPLTLNCPSGMTAEFTDEAGAVVNFNVTASDSCPGVVITATPPSGSKFPIGVTPVSVTATDSCNYSAQCSFNVTVLGALGVKSNVLVELKALAAATNFGQPTDQLLDAAICALADSLKPAYWIDQTHLQPKLGNFAMINEAQAAGKLDVLMTMRHSPIDRALLQGWLNRIVKSDRLLAVISIKDAAASGMNPRKIAEDWAMVARGDCDAAAGRYVAAIEQYRNAWRHAVQLRLKVCVRPDGTALIQFIGNDHQKYRIEWSADMAHWTPVGTCSADSDGNVEFTDSNAGNGLLRFYRAIED